jgi:hypothetical protein
MVFDSLHHDFGKINGDAKATYRFKVTNKGKAMLNITRLNPSCGCTSTVVGKWSLAPEESTSIEVSFNPNGFRGLTRKSIQVTSDDPTNPVQTLTFEANVVREIMASTESVFFQDVVRTAPRKASVKLESGTGSTVKVTEAQTMAGSPYLFVATRQDGKDVWLDITLDGRKIPAGKEVGADVVNVRTTNPKVPTLAITVQWETRPAISVDPVRVAWVEPAGQEYKTTLTLRQMDNKPFHIRSAKTTNPLVTVELGDTGASSTHKIHVVMSPKAKAGSYMERVLLTLDDPDQPELEIRVSASLR